MKNNFFAHFILLLTACVLVLSSLPVFAEESYTYESEFAKLPDEIKSMSNIRLVDDHDEGVVQYNCGDNKSPNHFYGSSYFTGNSGASLTFEFEGSVIGVLVEKGGFDVYLDEEPVGTFFASSRSDKKSQFVYYNDQLENDYHLIKVVTNKDVAVAETGDQYSVFRGFIIQENVPSGGATKAPTEAPTDEIGTEAPDSSDVPDSTVQPTQAPQSTAEPKVTAESKASTDTNDGNNNALLAVLIVLAVLVVAAAVALIIIKKK